MSLQETLRAKLTDARKSRKTMEMGILQVVLGDADLQKARTGKEASDEEVEKMIRKMATGISETLAILDSKGYIDSSGVGDAYAELKEEEAYVATLLPKTLTVEEIKANLEEIKENIRNAKNAGQATGIAVKHLKSKGLKASGENIASAVEEVRQ